MKLNEVRPYLETSGELEEQFFSIQDTGMIFDILRNKMYSNPILAIAREISCNARDAHREIGKADVPIIIHLPNTLEPSYKIKDFGPGISPDRMSNIFIKYTASTKREDNVQTGGFGLGAKTPFSYSDSFAIVTVHNGIKYLYNCVIDSTKVGKLLLGNEEPTDEPSGTEIIIPVLPKNFNEFATWTEQACRHWTVKPTITGGKIDWQTNVPILEGNNWAVVNAAAPGNRSYYDYNRTIKAIIDGIEYPLDLDVLRKYADRKLFDSCRGSFLMYFGVGELSLSASREQVYLDEKTQNVIKSKLNDILREIKQQVESKISNFPSYWDANVFYRKELTTTFNDISFLGVLTWNGLPLNNYSLDVGVNVYNFIKGKNAYRHGSDPNKISRGIVRGITFEPNSVLFVNDTTIKEPTPRHVKQAFESDPDLKSVQVVCPTDKISIEDLNKSYHLDKMLPKLLSSITKASGRTYTAPSARLLVFKFETVHSGFRQVSYSSIEEDTNARKVLCTLSKLSYPDVRLPLLSSNTTVHPGTLNALLRKFPDTTFYGVDSDAPAKRVSEDFEDFITLEKFIKEDVLASQNTDYSAIKFARDCHYSLDERNLRNHDTILPLIKNPDSLFARRLRTHLSIREMSSKDLGLLDLYEAVNGVIDDKTISDFKASHPEFDLNKLEEEYIEKYPLIKHLTTYHYSDIISDVAQYINLIDKE